MHRSVFTGLAALLLAALLPGPVHAFAQFGGTALTNLTLTGVGGGQTLPSGVSVLYSTAVGDVRAFSFGRGAIVSAESVLNPDPAPEPIEMPFGPPAGLGQLQEVDGWAGDGYADARMLTNGLIFLTNDTNNSVTFSFYYAIDAVLTAAADPLGIQARVDVNWVIDDLLGLVDPGTGGAQSISLGAYADPDIGTRELIASGVFSITLAAHEGDTLSSGLDTWGIAEAPEPPVWALIAAGLVSGLARVPARRRRRGV